MASGGTRPAGFAFKNFKKKKKGSSHIGCSPFLLAE
jgi:hypothetical protein